MGREKEKREEEHERAVVYWTVWVQEEQDQVSEGAPASQGTRNAKCASMSRRI